MAALVQPVYDCLFRLVQPDALTNEEEVSWLGPLNTLNTHILCYSHPAAVLDQEAWMPSACDMSKKGCQMLFKGIFKKLLDISTVILQNAVT